MPAIHNQTPIFQYNAERPPDSDFEPGTLGHLVVHNTGRLLDYRRTPVRLTALNLASGMFEVELLDFEDKGARWLYPFEEIRGYQFAKTSARATPEQIEGFERTIGLLDRPLCIECNPRLTQATHARLAEERRQARSWLLANSRFLRSDQPLNPASLDGRPLLQEDLQEYMRSHELSDMEERFASQWASNSESGEFIKGHRIVIAEAGLSPYEGKVVRDPALFDEPSGKARRLRHLLTRMAFVQEVFSQRAVERPLLYRALSCSGPLEQRNTKRALISATFNRDVAEALFGERDTTRTVVLYRQTVALERLLMTHLETWQLNRPFREAEAVLIADPANLAF
jgi:hypothetical protein